MKLATYLSENTIAGSAFAQKIGVSQVTVSRYIRNERFPDPEIIERIFHASGKKVSVTDWYEQAAEARAAKAGAAA